MTPADHMVKETDTSSQARGPLMMDAHLAALTIEHGGTLATVGRDFSRFHGLRTIAPTAG